MKPDTARSAALRVLCESEKEGAHLYSLLRKAENNMFFSAKDKALINKIVSGVYERLLTIDFVLDKFSKIPVKKMKPYIRWILRMGVYQLLFTDRIHDGAAVSESVELARDFGFEKLTPFVNGVLRNIGRNKYKLDFPSDSIKYSVPDWICGRLENYCGKENSVEIFSEYLTDSPLTIRLDERYSLDERRGFIERMKQKSEGLEIKSHPLLPYTYILKGSSDIRGLYGFDEGYFAVQDAAAQLVVEAAGIKDGDVVIDVCAAPGGKTLHAYSKTHIKGIKNESFVYAFDLTENKCGLIRENAHRMKADLNLDVRVHDSTKTLDELKEKADVLICDLPCSGLGVIGRKADIKYRIKEDDIYELQKLQRRILKASAAYLKKGGTLMYSTCTLTREENEDNFEYIKSELGFKPRDLEKHIPDILKDIPSVKNGYITLFPGKYKTDGFFISGFKK